MQIENFPKEFVERTKKIISEEKNISQEYEVTLLLNCLLGLISLPTESTSVYGNSQEDDVFRDACLQKLQQMQVCKKTTSDDQTFRTIKNALSHCYIELGNYKGTIAHVIFSDKKPGQTDCHTKISFTVAQLKEFAIFVAEKHLERCQKKVTNK